MGRTREQVHGGGSGEPITLLRQQLYIPTQGGRVAGDIDDALRPHPGHGVDDLRGQALSGRVHADHIRVQLLRRQLGGDVSGIAAEKLRILYAVSTAAETISAPMTFFALSAMVRVMVPAPQ